MVVNPYRDQESGVIGDIGFKVKVKKSSPTCGNRAVVLFVLICIICGSYYLHLRFHTATLRDNPSVRGSINTYKSFSQSIREFPTQMQIDLAKLDEKKNPRNPPIDLKKPTDPADVQKPGKINTFRTESEKKQAENSKTPINPPTTPMKAKPLEPLSPEMVNRLEMESRNANAVEDRVLALNDAEKLRKQRERAEVLERQRLQQEQKKKAEQDRLEAERKQREDKERHQAEQKQREEEERVKAEQRWREEQQAVAAKREEERQAKIRLAEQAAAAIAAAVPERPAPAAIPENPAAQAVTNVEPAKTAPEESVPEVPAPEVAEPAKQKPETPAEATPPEVKPAEPIEVVEPDKANTEEAVEHSAEKDKEEVPEVPPDLPQVHDHEHEHPSVGGEEQNTAEKDVLHPAHVLPLQVPPPHDGQAPASVVEGNPEFPHEEEPHAKAAEQLEHNLPPVEATLKQANALTPPVVPDQPAAEAEPTESSKLAGNAETPKRPTGYDLPAAIKTKAAAADSTAAAPAEKIDYCAGHVDPFQATPVDTFEPPAGAGFEEALQWRNAVKAMVSKISKVKYGGEELRTLIKGEVETLRIMRFKMFCKYA